MAYGVGMGQVARSGAFANSSDRVEKTFDQEEAVVHYQWGIVGFDGALAGG